MYEAIEPLNGLIETADAMEKVDEAVLAFYDAFDITFAVCAYCGEEDLVELMYSVAPGKVYCSNCRFIKV